MSPTTRFPSRHTLREAALDAAKRGWRVFPLDPGGTQPATAEWEKRATTDTSRIELAWRHAPYNIGLVPCASGLIVLDLLAARPGEVPPTEFRLPGVHNGADVLALLTEAAGAQLPTEVYTIGHPNGGYSMFFAHPDELCPTASPGLDSELGWHIAIRSAASYIPMPQSYLAGVGNYTLVHDAPITPLPSFLARLCAGLPRSANCARRTDSRL